MTLLCYSMCVSIRVQFCFSGHQGRTQSDPHRPQVSVPLEPLHQTSKKGWGTWTRKTIQSLHLTSHQKRGSYLRTATLKSQKGTKVTWKSLQEECARQTKQDCCDIVGCLGSSLNYLNGTDNWLNICIQNTAYPYIQKEWARESSRRHELNK